MIRTVVIKHNICIVLLVSILYSDLCVFFLFLFFFYFTVSYYMPTKKSAFDTFQKKTRTIYCKRV